MSDKKPLHVRYESIFRYMTLAFEAASIGVALEGCNRRPIKREIIEIDVGDALEADRDAAWKQERLKDTVAALSAKFRAVADGLYVQSPMMELPRHITTERAAMSTPIGRINISAIEYLDPIVFHMRLKFICCLEQVELLEAK